MRNALTTKRNNWTVFDELEKHLGGEFFTPFAGYWNKDDLRASKNNQFVPSIEGHENDTEYRFLFDLPGMKKEDINIEVKGDHVVVSGERKSELEEKDGNRFYSEKIFGRFERTLKLPENIDFEKVEARHGDGVLTLVLPKKDKVTPKKIEIMGH